MNEIKENDGIYLKKLTKIYPDNQYFGIDLSTAVMNYFNLKNVTKKQGNLTNIPYPDNYFDFVYTCESLKHAIDIKSAVCELCRVTKANGTIAIVDKNKDMLGYFEIEEWEQWFDEKEIKDILSEYCSEVEILKEIHFDNEPANGLFYCGIGKIKE